MKKVGLNHLVIAALAISAAFTSCGGGGEDYIGDKVQLLETITSHINGSYTIKYEYDNLNRIIGISEYDSNENRGSKTTTFSYSGNDLVKIVSKTINNPEHVLTTEYSKNGNRITMMEETNDSGYIQTSTINLNDEGFPTKFETIFENGSSMVRTYQIQNNNLTKHSYIHTGISEISTDYKYDNNKSPFYHCNTPKWHFIIHMGLVGNVVYCGQNNVTEISTDGGRMIEYEYEYNSAGFPTKCTISGAILGGENVTTFKYR